MEALTITVGRASLTATVTAAITTKHGSTVPAKSGEGAEGYMYKHSVVQEVCAVVRRKAEESFGYEVVISLFHCCHSNEKNVKTSSNSKSKTQRKILTSIDNEQIIGLTRVDV